MLRPKAVIFDFDGTLVDTMGSFADLAASIMHRRFGMDRQIARRRYLETSGLPFRQQLEIILPEHPENDDASDEFEEGKQRSFFSEHFEAEVKFALARLRDSGYLVMVSSNNSQTLVDRFVAREPDVQFHEVLGARRNFFKGSDHFNHIERKFSLRPEEMLFVGDSLKDGERAISSNVAFVGKLGTFKKQDFEEHFPGLTTIEMISDLQEVLP